MSFRVGHLFVLALAVGLLGTIPSTAATTDRTNDSLYIQRIEGNLSVDRRAQQNPYQIYFHIPVPFRWQVPIHFELECDQLIDYRFVAVDPPNVVCCARLTPAPLTELTWQAWVLTKMEAWADLPTFVNVSELASLPDSVLPFLQATDCCQVDDPLVQNRAQILGGSCINILDQADAICDYVEAIPGGLPHTPIAFDAVYTLRYGNSCTGHAHAATALLRALGIPARNLLNVSSMFLGPMDQHWIIEFFLPTYGWVLMETAKGELPTYPMTIPFTWACHPHDEYPLFYTHGIESRWFSSDPSLGIRNPRWGGGHSSEGLGATHGPVAEVALAKALAESVFACQVAAHGAALGPAQTALVAEAEALQAQALELLYRHNLAGFTSSLQTALATYQSLDLGAEAIFYFEDFEAGDGGWTHSGTEDEWEWGVPTRGPDSAWSGLNCWGTDLDGRYESNTYCWLQSSAIDLTGLARATLDFWVFLNVESTPQIIIDDPFWVEVSDNGSSFVTLSSHMGGVNDDPDIPGSGGWNHVALDLTPWVGQQVWIRFGFSSDGAVEKPGAYVDDVRVTGRFAPESLAVTPGSGESDRPGEDSELPAATRLVAVSPNPFNPQTTVTFTLSRLQPVRLVVYSLTGRPVAVFVDGCFGAGAHTATWDGRDGSGQAVASGAYLLRLESSERVDSRKILLVR